MGDHNFKASRGAILNNIKKKENKDSLGVDDMVFCMNSSCINYWEDSCMKKGDDKISQNVKYSREYSMSMCPLFKHGTNYIYSVIDYCGKNYTLNELLFIADYLGHTVIRFKLDYDSAVIEREDGTPMAITISEYIHNFKL